MNYRSRKPGRYAVVLLGASALAVSTLAAAAPSFAAKVTGPPQVRSHLPALRVGINLSVLPATGRLALSGGASKELFGVFCNSPTDCWSVGETKLGTSTVNQVLHWTGKKWFNVAVPNQAGTGSNALNELFAVRCTSELDCWAVGDSQRHNQAELDQILHFTGKKWFVASAPAPGGTAAKDINGLDDVACTTDTSCWAVGSYGVNQMSTNPQVAFTQALHWDGKKWAVVKTPNPAGTKLGHLNILDSVRCASPTDCWAAGTGGTFTTTIKFRNVILHWDGKKWASVTVPSPVTKGKSFLNDLTTLACTAADNCWAVGSDGKLGNKGFEHNEALHWTGKMWTVAKTPNTGGKFNELFGVTCAAATDCWAVGTAGSQPGNNQALHWTGKTWSVVHVPNGGGNSMNITNNLNSIRCANTSDCWAVGSADEGGNVDLDQIVHWNGTKWGITLGAS